MIGKKKNTVKDGKKKNSRVKIAWKGQKVQRTQEGRQLVFTGFLPFTLSFLLSLLVHPFPLAYFAQTLNSKLEKLLFKHNLAPAKVKKRRRRNWWRLRWKKRKASRQRLRKKVYYSRRKGEEEKRGSFLQRQAKCLQTVLLMMKACPVCAMWQMKSKMLPSSLAVAPLKCVQKGKRKKERKKRLPAPPTSMHDST